MKLRFLLLRLVRFAVAMLALAAAGAVVVAMGGRWSVKLDVLTHFAPVYAVMALSALVLWLLMGRKGRLTLLACLLALVGAAALMGPELLAARAAERMKPRAETLKIVQFNLYYLNTAPQKAADWVLAQDADIVVVEEGLARALPIVERLEAAYPYSTSCPDDSCGTRIFSRRPAVAPPRVRGSFVSARFEGEQGPYTVAGAHYVWPEPINPQHLSRLQLIRMLRDEPRENLIVAGDFNSTPWSFALRRQDVELGLQRRTRALFSWSPRRGWPRFLAIDHVYAGSNWKTVSVRRGPWLGSDHYPVVVELTR